jgi:Pretoxin HINT domain
MVSQGVVSLPASTSGSTSTSTSTSDAGVVHADAEGGSPAVGSNLSPWWEGTKAFGASLWNNTFGGPVNDARRVWANTEGQDMNFVQRVYVAGGTGAASFVGVRHVSDAFSKHDAVDGHVQSTQERVVKGIGGGVQLVTTATGLNSVGNAVVKKVVGKATAEIIEEAAANSATRAGVGEAEGAVAKATATVEQAEAAEAGALAKPADLEAANNRLKILQDMCFAAGTPLLTPEGSKYIEDFRVGDLILSRAEDDPEAPVMARRVLNLFQNYSPLLDLHVGGRVIRTTAEHPFWVVGKGWVLAHQIEVGDQFLGADGERMAVGSIDGPGDPAPVYNVEVEEYHTYLVGSALWGFSVWAHNDDCPVAPNAGQKSLLPGEGAVGTYDDLIAAGSKGDNLTPHHIPSAKHMEQHGVSRGDGISINMEQSSPGTGGRHRQTFTYGTDADVNLSPRDALGRGVWDARRIYQGDGSYGPYIRSQLQELILRNKQAKPGLFD